MAKKLITNGVDSSVLVKNLNSDLLGNYNNNYIIPYNITRTGSNNSNYGILITLNQEVNKEIYGELYIKGQIQYQGQKIIDLKIAYWSPSNYTHTICYNNGYNIGPIYIFDWENYPRIWFLNPRTNLNNHFHIQCINNLTKESLVKSVEHMPMPTEGVEKLFNIPIYSSAYNRTGNTFDIVDLPSNVSTLDLDSLPPIANVSTIILRYNGVVQDLDTYVSQDNMPVMPLPMSDEVEVSAETPSTLELNSGIAPMVNLDEYVGTPNNWLKIYVPEKQIDAYIEKYPFLVLYFYKITRYSNPMGEIGGINLLKNSRTFEGWSLNSLAKYEDFGKFKVATIENTPTSGFQLLKFYYKNNEIILKKNNVYTLSFWAKGTGTLTVYVCYDSEKFIKGTQDFILTDEYQRFSKTVLITEDYKNLTSASMIQFRCIGAENNASVYGVKLENGPVATDWTPAPEDIENEIKDDLKSLDDKIEFTDDNLRNELSYKANVWDLSNVVSDRIIDEETYEEFDKFTRDDVKMDLFIDMWNNACGAYGKYNVDTRFFECNEITDLTYSEALNIYQLGKIDNPFIGNKFEETICRTVLPFRLKTDSQIAQAIRLIAYNGTLIKIRIGDDSRSIRFGSLQNMFLNCIKLTHIFGIFDCRDTTNYYFAFYNCNSLEEIRLMNVKNSIDFNWCKRLSFDTLNYLISNAANTSVITITVHPDIYSALQGEASEYAFNGGTQEEWQQLLQDATEKQIIFATVS